jgi:DNA mismatch endonuclease (patch repair protein)
MPDRISKETRSKIMSHIKGKDTSIELLVRKYLYHHGFRYKKNVRSLPGTPDIVLEKYHTVIFINGCFWHHHDNCKYAVMPKTRKEYWVKKINRNVDNDVKHYNQLRRLGYKVITVWECEIKEAFEGRMKLLIEEIIDDEYNDLKSQY